MSTKHRREFLRSRKPSAAAKHVPEGHTEMLPCPTCHGAGKVPKNLINTVAGRALGRA